jgi:glycerol-3-phosphate dehydrogenase
VFPFSARTRSANLTRMAEQRFDLLVIGGGIAGAGIALDAASRGYSVALVEKDDYASGTSGRSSRLVHGGLRYLEQREFGLVRESLRERGILFRLAPHLIRPVPMYMPADTFAVRARYRAGLSGYELLAAGRNIGFHTAVNARQAREAIPGLVGWPGGYRYFECRTDDARLTIEVARTAQAFGAVLANHARVEGFLGGARVTGATVADQVTGQRFDIRAGVTVNATGIWADRVVGLAAAGVTALPGAAARGERLLPSKGVHLVFAPGAVRTRAAVVLRSVTGDGRFIFLVPWEDRVYAGTTDTPYSGDLDHPLVDDSDRDYILSAVAQAFPGVTGRDVVASWAGLRPLLAEARDDARTSDLSRKHVIFEDPPGLFTITGGKLTTYRAMAEDLVDRIGAVLGSGGLGSGGLGSGGLGSGGHGPGGLGPGGLGPGGLGSGGHGPGGPCLTRRIPLGLHGPVSQARDLATAEAGRLGLAPGVGIRLVQRYGDDWRTALRMIGEDPSLGEPVAEGLPVLNVELDLARSREMALTDEDVLVRRTRLTSRGVSVRLPAS